MCNNLLYIVKTGGRLPTWYFVEILQFKISYEEYYFKKRFRGDSTPEICLNKLFRGSLKNPG